MNRNETRSAYGEWCPICGAAIVSVTRGIPSMGTCSNSHVTDRRDTLRRPPANPLATEMAALRKERDDALTRLAAAEGRVTALTEALVWCSGSDDFQVEGKARIGWIKLCAPLLATVTQPADTGEGGE